MLENIVSGFSNKKGKTHLIINSESVGRGELVKCPNSTIIVDSNTSSIGNKSPRKQIFSAHLFQG